MMDQGRIDQAVAEAVDFARRTHQQWHWGTREMACPWGCGDGSGIEEVQE